MQDTVQKVSALDLLFILLHVHVGKWNWFICNSSTAIKLHFDTKILKYHFCTKCRFLNAMKSFSLFFLPHRCLWIKHVMIKSDIRTFNILEGEWQKNPHWMQIFWYMHNFLLCKKNPNKPWPNMNQKYATFRCTYTQALSILLY